MLSPAKDTRDDPCRFTVAEDPWLKLLSRFDGGEGAGEGGTAIMGAVAGADTVVGSGAAAGG